MQLTLVILSALAPAVVLLWYIYRKDRVQPEPAKWLIKAFGFGVVSAFLGIAFSRAIGAVFGMQMDIEQHTSIGQAFADAFCLAATPEECAKLLMLWLLLRKNPYFDEHFDGIVYAVCIGMGFAAFENVLYLMEGLEDGSWVGTGIARALFSVPGHFLFAVFMGYYYSLYHFGIDRNIKGMVMILAAPIFAHGMFDGIIFSMSINEALSGICMILFLILFNKIRKRGKARINELMNK